MISIFRKKKNDAPAKEKDRKIRLQKEYVDKNGNIWYSYVNPLTIPAKRAIAAEVATRFAEMNLTKSKLAKLIEDMKSNANKGNIVELFNILAEIEFRMNFIGEKETLIELGLCYYVMNDEDETGFDDVWRQRKLDALNADSDAMDFFLQRSFQSTIQYSNISGIDILEYLKQNGLNEKRLELILHKLK